jgi:hypothetical protein
MKSLLFCLTTALILGTAGPSQAIDSLLKATVSGTIHTQTLLSVSEGRIHTEKLDVKRVFAEFGASPDDYALVVDVSGAGVLELIPRHTAAMLPTLVVLTFGSAAESVVDTRTHLFAYSAPIAPGSATNLFEHLAGEMAGTLKSSALSAITKISLEVLARGSDTVGTGPALLKFKLSASGAFVQQP